MTRPKPADVVEVVGFACVVAGLSVLAVWLALVVAGAGLILGANAAALRRKT